MLKEELPAIISVTVIALTFLFAWRQDMRYLRKLRAPEAMPEVTRFPLDASTISKPAA